MSSSWSKGRRLLQLIVLILLAAILIWLGISAFHALRLAAVARTAQMELLPLLDEKGALDPGVVALAVPQLHQAAADLGALERLVAPVAPVINLFGPAASQVPALLEYASSVSDAADRLVIVFSPVLAALSGDGSAATDGLIPAALSAITSGVDEIQAAQTSLDRAVQARQKIDLTYLPGEAQELIRKADERFPQLVAEISFLEVIPELLGANGPRTYLLVIQNKDELRATGGFISGLGTLRIDAGKVVEMEIGDSYAIDDFSKAYPPPPDPLNRFMLAGYWVPRDGNWSPDFPTSARQVASLYTLSTGREVDGVIALDLDVLKGILESTGEIQVPGFPGPVDRKNLESLVQAAWSAEPGQTLDAAWWQGRKDFMGTLGKALLGLLLENPNLKLITGVADHLEDALDEGHLLLYFDHPEAEAALAQSGWAGSLPDTIDGDFLYLVDSNLGFNKMDARVRRQVNYQVDLSSPQKPVSHLEIIYTNPVPHNVACVHEANYGSGAYQDMQRRCYWDYYRIYLPAGSELIQGQGPLVKPEWLLGGATPEVLAGTMQGLPPEAGLQPFAGMLVVPANSQAQVSLDAALPAGTLIAKADGSLAYRLTIYKQAGLDVLELSLSIQPPAGNRGILAEGWVEGPDGLLTWSGRITQATRFELIFVAE